MQCLPTHATRSAILGRLEWLGWLGRQSAVLSHRDAGSAGARLNGCTHQRPGEIRPVVPRKRQHADLSHNLSYVNSRPTHPHRQDAATPAAQLGRPTLSGAAHRLAPARQGRLRAWLEPQGPREPDGRSPRHARRVRKEQRTKRVGMKSPDLCDRAQTEPRVTANLRPQRHCDATSDSYPGTLPLSDFPFYPRPRPGRVNPAFGAAPKRRGFGTRPQRQSRAAPDRRPQEVCARSHPSPAGSHASGADPSRRPRDLTLKSAIGWNRRTRCELTVDVSNQAAGSLMTNAT